MNTTILVDKENALSLIEGSELIGGYNGTRVRVGRCEEYGEFILLDGPFDAVMVVFDKN